MAMSFALSKMDKEGIGNHPLGILCWTYWPSSVLAADPSSFPQEMRPPPQCLARTLVCVVADKRTNTAVGL